MARAGTVVAAASMSKLSRNIAYNLGGQLAVVALSFLAARYLFRVLGRDVLGLVYFAQTINAIVIAVVDVGVGITIVKEISAHHRDRDHIARVVRTGAAFAWSAYLVFALALVVAAPAIVDHWLALEHLDRATAVVALRILGASTLLTIPHVFYSSVFRGLQSMGPPNLVDVGGLLVQQTGTALLARSGHGIATIAWWIAGTYAARVLVMLALTAGLFSWRGLAPRFDASTFRATRSATLHMVAISILGVVHTQTDTLVISHTLPLAAVGLYGLVWAAINRGGILSSAVVQGALPVFAELVAGGRRDDLLRHYHRLQTLICYGLVPFYALLALGSRHIFGLVFGASSAEAVVIPAHLLALGFYLNSSMSTPYFVAIADNRPELATRFAALALAVTLPVTFLLTWRFGFVGAALAWVWYQLFAYLRFIPAVCRECLETPISRWYASVAEPLALAAITYGGAIGISHVWELRSWPAFVVTYAIATAVFVGGTWWRIGADRRLEVVQFVRSRFQDQALPRRQ